MDKIYDKCCGIDVHKKLIVACFRYGKQQEIREFGATTRELLELAGQVVVQMRVPEISLVSGLQAQNKHDLCRYSKYKRQHE